MVFFPFCDICILVPLFFTWFLIIDLCVFTGEQKFYYAVTVVRKGSLPDVKNLRDLRSKKACFTGVGTLAGWVIPIYTVCINENFAFFREKEFLPEVYNNCHIGISINSIKNKNES